LLASTITRGRKIIHVHELPTGRKGRILRFLLKLTNGIKIYNSEATRRYFEHESGEKSYVLPNGIADPGLPPAASCKVSGPLKLLMLGRLNRWKGQDLLLRSLAMIPSEILNQIQVRVVGSTFERDTRLEEELRALGNQLPVKFEPFTPNTKSLYLWSDVVVVPSKSPEAFGRIPVEAMAYGRPAIVASHGGLAETVIDGETGWRFAPNDARDLARVLEHVVAHREQLMLFGKAARRRYESAYTAEIINEQFKRVVKQSLDRKF
jgi:glycosyltransferase involved in cell wall biosynthesis